MEKILLHLDTDPCPNVFDQVVAYDSGVDRILAYGGITPENVLSHVHGLIFSRGSAALKNSAIFIGGADISRSYQVAQTVSHAFFGAIRVSLMLDPNGSNTTAAALVHKISLDNTVVGKKVVILGAGPVGQRVAYYLWREGAKEVTLASRVLARAQTLCNKMKERYGASIIAGQADNEASIASLVASAQILITTGPSGVQLLSSIHWQNNAQLEVLADVNALPPLGIEGIDVNDDGSENHGIRTYGALAIGNTKMKLHRMALASLFNDNQQWLDETKVFDLAKSLT